MKCLRDNGSLARLTQHFYRQRMDGWMDGWMRNESICVAAFFKREKVIKELSIISKYSKNTQKGRYN